MVLIAYDAEYRKRRYVWENGSSFLCCVLGFDPTILSDRRVHEAFSIARLSTPYGDQLNDWLYIYSASFTLIINSLALNLGV